MMVVVDMAFIEPDDDFVGRITALATDCALRCLADAIESLARQARADIEAEVRERYAGSSIRICKRSRVRIAARNEAMRAEHAAGTPLADIARYHHVSPGHARRIVRLPHGRT